MITGYNTDVRRGDVVFHVQTEDKGLANPSIESVIYVSGQVLAARRASYSSLLAEGRGEREIAAMMDHQHRTIIAAIRAGRFDEKVSALASGRGPVRAGQAALAPERQAPVEVRGPGEVAPTLDQVILEYLSTEAEHEQLLLVLEEGSAVVPGGRNLLAVRASSSKTGQPVAGAQVSVKILSTVAEPRTIVAGETDVSGRLDLALDVPRFERGTGALIISAVSALGRAEIKSLL